MINNEEVNREKLIIERELKKRKKRNEKKKKKEKKEIKNKKWR